MAKASPSGRGPVDRIRKTPSDPSRQSRGPSLPSGKRPGKGSARGGDARSSGWGTHLQGNKDKGGAVKYRNPPGSGNSGYDV
jgi:hypothetical protein